jgi:hypothetical protein
VQAHIDDLSRHIKGMEAQASQDAAAYGRLQEEREAAQEQLSSIEELMLSTNSQVETLSLVRPPIRCDTLVPSQPTSTINSLSDGTHMLINCSKTPGN